MDRCNNKTIKREAINYDYTLDIIFYVHKTPTTVPSKNRNLVINPQPPQSCKVDIHQDQSAALNLRNIGMSFIGEWHRDYMRALFISFDCRITVNPIIIRRKDRKKSVFIHKWKKNLLVLKQMENKYHYHRSRP